MEQSHNQIWIPSKKEKQKAYTNKYKNLRMKLKQ